MLSLAQVLDEAAGHNATELVVEAGRTPLLRSSDGVFPLGVPVSERDLFDALEAVLEPEQLADLAVGQVVEFHVDVRVGRWTLLGEPSADGMIIRGCLQGLLDVGDPMELPPLEPFAPSADHGVGATGMRSEASLRNERPVVHVTVEDDDTPAWLVTNREGRESSTPSPLALALEDDDNDELPDILLPELGEDEEDDVMDQAMDGSRRQYTTDLPGMHADIGAQIPMGTLCFVQGRGAGEVLARDVDDGAYTVIDDDQPETALRLGANGEPGATFVFQLEDPSPFLGWILRRLEEGARVLVETRARTMAGARRSLLGVHYGENAALWLEAHPIAWATERKGAWIIEREP